MREDGLWYNDPFDIRDAEAGSGALLAALREHHDFDVRAPKGWKPRQKKAVTIPISVSGNLCPRCADIELKKRSRSSSKRVEDIKAAVCTYFKVSELDLISDRRTKDITYVRQLGFFLAKKHTRRSFQEIGRRFGDKDHSTVVHAVKKFDLLIRSDAKVVNDISAVESLL